MKPPRVYLLRIELAGEDPFESVHTSHEHAYQTLLAFIRRYYAGAEMPMPSHEETLLKRFFADDEDYTIREFEIQGEPALVWMELAAQTTTAAGS